jgi:hypothetical protein
MQAETLLVVAGPRASGKSRFIANCRRNKALQRIAPDLARLFELAPRSIRVSQTPRHAGKVYPAAIIHLDIYTPFEFAPVLPAGKLKEWMTPERFVASDGFRAIQQARELYAVTLLVPRQTVLVRWLDRKSKDSRRQVSTNLVRILSADDGSLYRHLYAVWHEVLRAARPKRHWHVTEKDGGYVINEFTGGDAGAGRVVVKGRAAGRSTARPGGRR